MRSTSARPEAPRSRNHGRRARMHGVDDFGVVYALQVDRSDPEIGVSQLALDYNQRNPLPRHLDRMGMSKLV